MSRGNPRTDDFMAPLLGSGMPPKEYNALYRAVEAARKRGDTDLAKRLVSAQVEILAERAREGGESDPNQT